MATRKERPKTSFTLDGVNYHEIPYYSWGNDPNSISIGKVGTAKMIRQYIAQKYPKYYPHTWVQAGTGSSNAIDIYFNRIPDEDFGNLSRAIEQYFKEGYFDGMTDSYNYTKKPEIVSDGRSVRFGANYIFTRNTPPSGSPEYNQPAPNFSSTTTTKPVGRPAGRPSTTRPSALSNKGDLVFECGGWGMYKVKIMVRGVEKQVYKLRKNKETESNREKWDEIRGVMTSEFGLKWNKFSQSFDRFLEDDTFPKQQELCETLVKYYGGSLPTQAPETTTQQESPSTQWDESVNTYILKGYDTTKEKAWLVYKSVISKEEGGNYFFTAYLYDVETDDFNIFWKKETSNTFGAEWSNITSEGGFMFLIKPEDAKKAAQGAYNGKPRYLYIQNVDQNYDANTDPLKIGEPYETYVGITPYDEDVKPIRLLYARINWAEGASSYAEKLPKIFYGTDFESPFVEATRFIKENMSPPDLGYDKHGIDWLWSNGDWGEDRWDVSKGLYKYDNFWANESLTGRFFDSLSKKTPSDPYIMNWTNWYKRRDKKSLGLTLELFKKVVEEASASKYWQEQFKMSAPALEERLLYLWDDLESWLRGEPEAVYSTEAKIKAYELLLEMEDDPSEKNRIQQIIKALKLIS